MSAEPQAIFGDSGYYTFLDIFKILIDLIRNTKSEFEDVPYEAAR